MQNPLIKLLEKNGQEVFTLLKTGILPNHDSNKEINYLLLAEYSLVEARKDRSDALWWFRVAHFLYRKQLEENINEERELTLYSLMLVMANAILKFGTDVNDEVRNIDFIEQKIKEVSSEPLAEIISKASNWRSYNIEEIRKLRSLKNRLGVLQLLVENEKYNPSESIKSLLNIRSQLP